MMPGLIREADHVYLIKKAPLSCESIFPVNHQGKMLITIRGALECK